LTHAGMLDHAGIEQLIPHRGAMCLLVRLEHWDTERIVCSADNQRDTSHPLRTRSGLLSSCAIEYAAQAMALHGALIAQASGTRPSPGYLASARGVQLHVLRLDDLDGELRIEATRQAGGEQQILYTFAVSHDGRPVADGRAAVVLNTPLAAT
jgi:predicted hotdog family 3-hydroxylacyl-ACP dehydratase